jgi:hypothetical protein
MKVFIGKENRVNYFEKVKLTPDIDFDHLKASYKYGAMR